MNKKAVIYARVSSTGDRQDTERQVKDLTQYATSAGLDIVAVYREKASGAKDDREVLADCIAALKTGEANTLLLSELSRLGRSVRKILDVTEDLTTATNVANQERDYAYPELGHYLTTTCNKVRR